VPVLYTVLRRKPPAHDLADDTMVEATMDTAFETTTHHSPNNRLLVATSEPLASQEGRS
jgi:hypothetical protein